MQKLTEEQKQYLSDDMYLPIQYKGVKVEQPYYQGDGNHSVAQLQELCKQFQEYCHQQNVIKHHCMKAIVALKFGIWLDEPPQESQMLIRDIALDGSTQGHLDARTGKYTSYKKKEE